MKLNLIKKWLASFCLAGTLLSANTASAILISPGSIFQVATGNQTGQAQINTAIAGILGGSTELYKQEAAPLVEEGSLAGSYLTTFNVDLSGGLIEYISGSFVGGNPFLLVKDGNHSPAWYLFNLTGAWNGGENLDLSGFWPNGGSISHVTLYGTLTQGTPVVTSTPVPDGGATVALLGLALAGIAAVQRFQKKK